MRLEVQQYEPDLRTRACDQFTLYTEPLLPCVNLDASRRAKDAQIPLEARGGSSIVNGAGSLVTLESSKNVIATEEYRWLGHAVISDEQAKQLLMIDIGNAHRILLYNRFKNQSMPNLWKYSTFPFL